MNQDTEPQSHRILTANICDNAPLCSFFITLHLLKTMRKPLNNAQCITLTLLWAALCFIVLTSAPKIDGPLTVMLIISGALVFIPIIKYIKSRNK